MVAPNESSFTVIAPPNKNKPVFILDEDDDDDDYTNVPTIIMGTSPVVPMVKNVGRVSQSHVQSSSNTSHPCCLNTGLQSFQESCQLQRELLTLQESLFDGMTNKVMQAQGQIEQLQQEICRLELDLATTRTLLVQEQERNHQILQGYLHHYPPPRSTSLPPQDSSTSSSCSSNKTEGSLLVEFGSWSRRRGVGGGVFLLGNDDAAAAAAGWNLKDPGVPFGK